MNITAAPKEKKIKKVVRHSSFDSLGIHLTLRLPRQSPGWARRRWLRQRDACGMRVTSLFLCWRYGLMKIMCSSFIFLAFGDIRWLWGKKDPNDCVPKWVLKHSLSFLILYPPKGLMYRDLERQAETQQNTLLLKKRWRTIANRDKAWSFASVNGIFSWIILVLEEESIERWAEARAETSPGPGPYVSAQRLEAALGPDLSLRKIASSCWANSRFILHHFPSNINSKYEKN